MELNLRPHEGDAGTTEERGGPPRTGTFRIYGPSLVWTRLGWLTMLAVPASQGLTDAARRHPLASLSTRALGVAMRARQGGTLGC